MITQAERAAEYLRAHEMTEFPPYVAEHMPHPAKTEEIRESVGVWLCSLTEKSYQQALPHDAHDVYNEGYSFRCPGVPGMVPATPSATHEARLDQIEKSILDDLDRAQEALNRVHAATARRERLVTLIEITKAVEG